MVTPLLNTKLYVPPARLELVPRPRLVERLDEGLRQNHRLTLISAPAGFGKTTLIAAWLRSVGRPCAWLSLDEADNDPSRFLAYLVTALQRVDPGIGQSAQMMLQSARPLPSEPLLTNLINDIAALSSPFILVLDDYHWIQALPVHQEVALLLDHGPPQLHLVIASREDPLLPLSRLRARGQMSELRQADLRLTEEEASDFLRRVMQLNLSAADISALHRHTEGWIAGLQLAALSLHARDGVGRLVQSFAGNQRYVMDYLFDEVFQRQGDDVQRFLLQTSVLEHLTAALCDAVTGRKDSREVLLALERANLFLVPLDESRQWYRYHHLFHDLLHSQRKAFPLAPLHQKAARWYEENGFLDQALRHALAAEDWGGAERLIVPATAEAIRTGRFVTLNRWLDALPEARVQQSNAFATAKAWALMLTGQFEASERFADLAEDLLPANAPLLSRSALVTLRTYLTLARFDLAHTIELCHQALGLLEEGDPFFLRGAALTNLGHAQALAGDVVEAVHTYRQLIRLGRQVGHLLSVVSASTNLAELLHLQGKRHEAVGLCQQALAQCVDVRGNPLPLAGLAHTTLGTLHYEANELEPARRHLHGGLELGQQMGPSTGLLSGMGALAHLQQAMGEEQEALTTVGELEQVASQLALPHVDARVSATEALIRLRQGDIAAVERWAQTAGLSPTDPPHPLHESAHLTYARLLLAQNRAAEARALLDRYECFAREGERYRSLIAICILQARVQQALGHDGQAIACLKEAVRLAAPEGYARVFLNEGQSVLRLLPGVRHVAPAFVDALIAAFAAEPGVRGTSPERPGARSQPLVEPLGERELEVLRLVAAGMSNREIASSLIITEGTVKSHVHNICGKLAVRSRTQAVARARELGLI